MSRRHFFIAGIVLALALACNTPQPTPAPEPKPTPTPTPGPYVPSERTLRACEDLVTLEFMETAYSVWSARRDDGDTKVHAIEVAADGCGSGDDSDACLACAVAIIDEVYGGN